MSHENSEKADCQKLWHSSSHILAAAVKELFPNVKFGIGPAIEEGFYYDFFVEKPFSLEDLQKIEKQANKIIAKNEPFIRKEVSKKEAKQIFKDQKFKLELIDELEEGKISTYTNGSFTDLCKGPHVEKAKEAGFLKVLKSSAAYWKGDQTKESMQRIYGISFLSQKELDEWENMKQEAEKRNHIKLGRELDLFSMQNEAPGTVFFHQGGTTIWNELVSFAREKQTIRDYKEVITPIILKKELWLRSGHWDHYKENMYFTVIDGEEYAVKPMNCPGHILIYGNSLHSYRDLPIRICEFGLVHRHELSGVLNGLLRVRNFTQDDTHIFCTPEQIEEEITGLLAMIDEYYHAFNFEYKIELSTRPEKAMGSKKEWDVAEAALKNALNKNGREFKINEGDGAFYGPKIDFHIKDSLGRSWQLGTIQLDFQMPEKFDIHYINKESKEEKPVMIHRAIFGSMERFIGILIEHYAGKFPLWLSPTQIRILSVTDETNDYSKSVEKEVKKNGIRVECDLTRDTLGKKIRKSQIEKIPYTAVVGKKEADNKTITIRNYLGKQTTLEVKEFIDIIRKEINEKTQNQLI